MSDARRSPPGPASAATGPRAKPPPDADSATPGDTIAAPPSRESPRTSDSIAFPSAILGEYDDLLSPPEAAGELGRLGGYRILRELGRGGMGIVFEAEDPRLGRRIALKVLQPELAREPRARERFLREARCAAAIEHEHVVPVYQVGEESGIPYLVMRLLPGRSLSSLLRRKRTLPIPSVIGLGRQAALGLAAAHERGLIHRDVKPANLWAEPDGRIRVLDFGLARSAEAAGDLTRQGAIVGTPEYLSPEQVRGGEIDARADLFALGAVLYRASTGVSPFRRRSLPETYHAVAAERPPAPRSLRPDLPEELAELILALLEKDPRRRPPSASSVAERLKEIGIALRKHPPSGGPSPDIAPAVSAATAGPESSEAEFPVLEVDPPRVAAASRKPKPTPKSSHRPGDRSRSLIVAMIAVLFAFLCLTAVLLVDGGGETHSDGAAPVGVLTDTRTETSTRSGAAGNGTPARAARPTGDGVRWKPFLDPSEGLTPGAVIPPRGDGVSFVGGVLHLRGQGRGYCPPFHAKDYVVRAMILFQSTPRSDGQVVLGVRQELNATGPGYGVSLSGNGRYELDKDAGGRRESLGTGTLAGPPSEWVEVALAAVGDRLTAYIDRQPVLDARDAAHERGKPRVQVTGVDIECLVRGFEICVLDGTTLTPEQALAAAPALTDR